MPQLTLHLIEEAQDFLKDKIRHTPVESSPILDSIFGVPIYLKLECLQITGSFKIRGAYFYLSRLSKEQRKNGIGTCSAGNHGKGIAFAAQKLGIKAHIYVTKNADPAKLEGIKTYGAEIHMSEFIGYDDTERWAKAECAKQKLPFISPFDDEIIMAGNGGTLGLEILEDIPDVATIVVPVGGGGLAGGLSYFIKNKNPQCKIIGCQHEGSSGLKLSFEQGKAMTTMPSLETIAAPLEGGIGEKCFQILRSRIDDVMLATEESFKMAFRWMISHHQYLVEPAGLVGIACLLQHKPQLTGPTVIVLSGRNTGLTMLEALLKD